MGACLSDRNDGWRAQKRKNPLFNISATSLQTKTGSLCFNDWTPRSLLRGGDKGYYFFFLAVFFALVFLLVVFLVVVFFFFVGMDSFLQGY